VPAVFQGMKVRDSGMPEREYWESLFRVEEFLSALGVDERVRDAVELGCGYGTFTVPLARRVSGAVHAYDIEAEMIEETRARLVQAGLGNVRLELRDVVASGYGLPDASVDAVLLFNILHAAEPVGLLREAARVTRSGGRVLAAHWRSDVVTPRGPALEIRPKAEQIRAWAERAGGLRAGAAVTLPPWHFGVELTRVA
jgi:ubiquinone/menaquinone biosynthesis C-methylase UbiE